MGGTAVAAIISCRVQAMRMDICTYSGLTGQEFIAWAALHDLEVIKPKSQLSDVVLVALGPVSSGGGEISIIVSP